MNWHMRLWQKSQTGVWYVEFERGKSKSLATKDKAEAKRLYTAVRRQWLSGRISQITGECTKSLGEFYDEFVELASNTQAPATYRANRLALEKLIIVAGRTCRLDRITHKHLDEIKASHKHLSPRSINVYVRHARAALNQAVAWGYLSTNPLRGVKEVRTARQAPAFMAPEDCARWLATIQDMDLRRMALAYLSTGVRRAELLTITWEGVDFEGRRFRVYRQKSKRWDWLPLSDTFAAVLRSMSAGRGRVFTRWEHPDTISHHIKAALVAGGYGHLHLHSLRHSFASALAMSGEGQKAIADLLGHAQVSTAAIYTHTAQAYLQNAVNKVRFGPVDLDG